LHSLLKARPYLVDCHTLYALMALMNSVGLHKEAIAAYEKFGVLCDYYGEEHDCGSAEVVAAWEQRRLLRRMDRSPAHHKLGGGDVSFLVGQLGLAYEHLKNIEKLRALVEENRGMRPTYAVGSLVKVLLSRGSAEDVEEAEELVQSFLEGGQDLRLISCWLEVQAKKGVDFDTAKTGLENWCRSCNSIVRPDVYCMFYLLKCKTKTEDSRPKADFLLSYIDDWDAIPRKEHLGAFLQCLLAVEEETAAVKFAEKHCRFADAAEKAIAACRPSLQRNAGPEDGGGRRGRVGSRGSVLRRGAGSGKEKGKDARRGGAGRGKGKDRGARRTNANGRKRKEKKESKGGDEASRCSGSKNKRRKKKQTRPNPHAGASTSLSDAGQTPAPAVAGQTPAPAVNDARAMREDGGDQVASSEPQARVRRRGRVRRRAGTTRDPLEQEKAAL